MNGKTKPHAILIFGVPMSGKTWFGDKFSAQFHSPFLNFNELPAIDRPTAISIVTQIAKSTQPFILEGLINTEPHRTELRKLLEKAGYRVAIIWVQTDVATIKRRLKTKFKTAEQAKNTFDDHVSRLEAPADTESPIVISGKHTFSAQLKIVLAGLSAL